MKRSHVIVLSALMVAACGQTFVATSGSQSTMTQGAGAETNTSTQASSSVGGTTSGTDTTSLSTTASHGSGGAGTTTSTRTVPDGCGDAVVAGAEECDDGNTVDNDACGLACKLARCGDGKLWQTAGVMFEGCDDGNTIDGDGCTADCETETCGGPCPLWDKGECVAGCAPTLCGGNTLCDSAGVKCDGSSSSECVGRCMLYGADCAAVMGYPNEPASAGLRSCVAACLLL